MVKITSQGLGQERKKTVGRKWTLQNHSDSVTRLRRKVNASEIHFDLKILTIIWKMEVGELSGTFACVL